MNTTIDQDNRFQELAERYYGLLADQLYDPQPDVDGYGKEKQQQVVTNLLHDLARDAAHLPAERDDASFALVSLNADGEPLCPKCDTPLIATIFFGSDTTTPFWHPEDEGWAYMVDGGDTYIERFTCAGCGWSAAHVEPREVEP